MTKLYYSLTIFIYLISANLFASQASTYNLRNGMKHNEIVSFSSPETPEAVVLASSGFNKGVEENTISNNLPNPELRSLIADFSADLTLIPTGNSVNFTDLSTGTITSRIWSFPGGSPVSYTGMIPPPVYYNTAGTYDVTLTITDGVDTVSTTKPAYINVVDYPAGWEFTKTATSHLISVATTITFSTALQAGDFIGVFYLDGNSQEKCGGASIWDGTHNKVVVAFGDDATTTTLKEGFASAENFIWKVYFNATSNVKNASVSYNTALPNFDGKFYDNGLSALTAMNTNPLEINATADPDSICGATQVQLDVTVFGGTGTYTYAWTSNPAGFTSTIKNPVHTPSVTTTYSVTVMDGSASVTDNVVVLYAGQPTANAGANATICETSSKMLPGTASNYASTLWTSSGDGTFNNPAVLYSTYTPGTNDKINGAATLTLTASPINPCTLSASDFMILTIKNSPVCDAGDDATICQTSTHTLSGTAQNQSTIVWSTSGNGTFSSTSNLNTVYTPGTTDISAGTVTITLTANAVSPCTVASTDTKILIIQKSPTANAGTDATTCETSTHQLSGTAQFYTSLAWSTLGDGTFSDPAIINPVYTPGTSDITNGTVTLTLTSSAISPCVNSTSDNKILVIRKLPVVNAGNDATICQTVSHSLTGSSAQNQSSVLWSTSGNGTFSNTAILSPVYSPGTTDILNGTVTLTLTANALSPCTGSVSDSKVLIIQKSPAANAGTDATICEGSTHNLEGTASNQGTIAWTTSGTGTFSSTSSLTSVYTPSAADITTGTVNLTLTASAVSPCTISASDAKTLVIRKLPVANAGNDVTICQSETLQLSGSAQNYISILWTTSGDGSFSATNSLTTVYSLGTTDISNGSVTLTLAANALSPCSGSTSDDIIVAIQKSPEASAGDDATICQGNNFQLAGSAQNYGTVSWSTFGDGTFSSTGSLNPVYTAGTADIAAGAATLTLTAVAISPCTLSASDDLTLTIQQSPSVFAGLNAAVCINDSYFLADASVTGSGSVLWSTTGDGTFDDGNLLNATYTPGVGDIFNGSAELCLTAQPLEPCTLPATDCMILVIQPEPTAFAGNDATICEDGTFLLVDATASNYLSILWSGNVDNPATLNAIYTPTAEDILAGYAELCLTAQPNEPCVLAASDCVYISIHLAPTADAGEDQTICKDQTAQLFGFADNFDAVSWSGNVDDPALLNPVYTPTPEDIAAGFAELCLTAQPTDPCTNAATDCLIITINDLPEVNAGDDTLICEEASFTTNPTVTNSTQVFWSTNGDGYFDDENAEIAVYYPGEIDYANGSVELCVIALGAPPCESFVEDCLVLSFQSLPVVDAGFDATICENQTIVLEASATNYTSVLWTGNVDDATILNPVYTPTALDIATGFAELCITAQPINPCTTSITDCVVITIQALPSVSAGADATIGEGNTYTVADASATAYSSLLWNSQGDGVFDDATSLHPTYTPGSADLAAASATLCLIVQPLAPCSISSEDCITIFIELLPVANAGPDATICENETFTPTGASALNYSSLSWTSSGDGIFDDPSILHPNYTPGTADILAGSAELCLTAQPLARTVGVAQDCLVLTFQSLPTAFAGNDITICDLQEVYLSEATAANYTNAFWFTTNGSGFFSNENIVNPSYYPTNTDLMQGCINLGFIASPVDPCSISATDEMQLCFQVSPSAFAGDEATICETETYALAGADADNYSSLAWTSSGDGVFDDASLLNPVYTPGSSDIFTGSVELTISAQPLTPCDVPAVASMMLTFAPQVTANAGDDLTITYNPESPEIQLNGTVANSSYFIWSTEGDGTFNDVSIEDPIYTPGTQDVLNGTVLLSLYAESILPCVATITDDLKITFVTDPTVFAGNDAIICADNSYLLSEATATFYSSLSWTSSGDGVFDDASLLHPTYTPGAGDILYGTAELCITAQPLARTVGVAQDCMVLTFQATPTAFAGNDITICDLQEVYLGEATAGNYNQVMWFTTNGAGIFSSENIVNPTYYPSMIDLQQGCISLGFIASPLNPCITSADDELQLCFQVSPSAIAGDDATICETETYALAEAVADNYSTLAWTSSGDGVFDDASLLNPVYTPGSSDIFTGTVELTISAQPLTPCDVPAVASMMLTFAPQVTADGGDDLTITYNPESPEIQLDGTVAFSSSFKWSTEGDGTFNDVSIEDPIYTPGTQDVLNGTILLSLYAESILPCQATVTDDLTITFVTDPTVFAGNDAIICADNSYLLSEATATFYSSLSWTSSGDGVFDDASLLHPTYTPGAGDILYGTAELCITAQPLARTVGVAQDCMVLTFQATPTAFAGNDITICDLQEVYLGEATAGNYQDLLWYTVNGGGFFNDDQLMNPIYYPSPTVDLPQGCITLGFVASPVDPCSTSATDEIQLCFQIPPSAFAADDATICETETYALAGADADNYSSLTWTTSGDGVFDDASVLNPVYTPGNGDIFAGSVELTISAQPLTPCDVAAVASMMLTILPNQQITIPAGWSGISSYIQPADANIETVMADVLDQLVIMFNYNNEIFYPVYNINTLNNWDSQKGYFIKVNDDATLNICGSKAGNLTLNLTAGWNIIPVLSNQDVPVIDVFAPLGSILTIIKEVAGYHIYYPEYGIYTLSSLMSGKAYLVRVTEDCSITFPESLNKSQINNPQSFIDVPDTWGEIIPTPSSHQIIFPAAITRSFNSGDEIGAFAADGLCAGTIRIDDFDNANALTVFGDDAYTSSLDGMAEGLEMTFKLFRPGTSQVFVINTEFTAGMNDAHFANNGISVVKALSLVSVNELVSGFNPNIYPNPAKNSVTIEFEGLTNGAFTVEMMNAFGVVVKRGESTETSANLDVSGLSRGVYYLRLTSGSQSFIEKLILQ